MNKRICIFGILLLVAGIRIGFPAEFLLVPISSLVLIIVGPVVIILGALLDEQKAKD